MQNTVVVSVPTIKTHPRYGKKIRRVKKFYAHDTKGSKEGDQVVIQEVRPLSKLKRWKVVEVLK